MGTPGLCLAGDGLDRVRHPLPAAYSFYLSFQNFDLSVGPEYEFVGVKNYSEALFRDERFMGSVWNTALLIAPSLVLELLLGLGMRSC